MGKLNIVAYASVIDLNAESESYLSEVKVEQNLVTVNQKADGTSVILDTNNLKVFFERNNLEGSYSQIKVDAPEINLKLQGTFDGSHESLYWATPLTEDKLTTFVTWKRSGISLDKCDYTFKGK